MGNYNPHAPRILGQEWVPIRNEDTTFSEITSDLELGHGFTLTADRIPDFGSFYIHDWPETGVPGDNANQVWAATVYRQGQEDIVGPIESCIIPVSAGAVTGTSTSYTSAQIAANLLTPSDTSVVSLLPSGTFAQLAMFFNVPAYPQLNGKRILGVQFLYNLYSSNEQALDLDFTNIGIFVRNDTVSQEQSYAQNFADQAESIIIDIGTTPPPVQSIPMSSYTPFWNLNSFSGGTDRQFMPWTWQTLLKFHQATVPGRIHVYMFNIAGSGTGTGVDVKLSYAALQVFYCEENRILASGWPVGKSFRPYILGQNRLPQMRSVVYPHNNNTVLPAGNYTVTISSPSLRQFLQGPSPILSSVRELYAIPPHPGVSLRTPFPLEDSIGDTLTAVETHVLTQLSLHATGGTMTEPHVYGRQAAAQVYGVNTVTQDIYDDISGTSASYPWVRYYARRFGETTVPLTLTGVGGLSGSSVAITPAEFDELDEILDGWKEVTLRFTTPPSMGAVGGFPAWTWSSAGETGGNRWEILAASAPALSGIPGSLYNLIPPPHQLGTATYQPTSGDTVELTWMPQGVASPFVTGASADAATDAVLIFAQDMPAVSGFTVSTLSQAISGIGQDCGLDPCCIPTAILYNQLAWTAGPAEGLSLPGTSGSIASTPDNAALDITGDIDLRADVTMDDWTPTATATLISKWFFADASYTLNIASTGLVVLGWSTDGSTILNISSTVAPVVANGTRLAIRATLDVNNGAAGHTVTFYTAPTLAGPWTQLGAPVITAGVTSIHSGGAAADVGGPGGLINLWSGTVHAAEILNGIGGSTVANPNFAAQIPGTTGFTDAAGRTWTMFGSSAIVGFSDASIEIQRQDTVDTEWKTIMLASGTDVSSFRDYEARTGIATSYRIRGVNVYDFPGPWSDTISLTMPAPGVSGGCLEGGHVLIFTSNEHQDGSINLAYSTAWMGGESVEENFVFPEAGFVQLQLMYNKDFYTAFRPLERGGERFQRTVLVQAAAIAPETLADFTSLRDMAWDSVNYICVRDEDGNRWLATVLVPGGRVLRDRRLYLAPVEVIEVTTTPTPVNP